MYTVVTRDSQLARIEELKRADTLVSFCTNPMHSRGTVYRCYISPGGDAVVVSASDWWSRSFVDAPEYVGKVLGAVVPAPISGSLDWQMSVGQLKEGNG